MLDVVWVDQIKQLKMTIDHETTQLTRMSIASSIRDLIDHYHFLRCVCPWTT
jgi:hypothetical protein